MILFAKPLIMEASSETTHAEHTPAAILSCACSKVQIAMAYPPVDRVECCCCDCRLAIQWCHETLGGPDPRRPEIADLLYFPNALNVLSLPTDAGDDSTPPLQVCMIQTGYKTRRVVVTCCGTALLGDHPNYRRRKFVTFQPPARLRLLSQDIESVPSEEGTTMTLQGLPAQRRIFTHDLSLEEQKSSPPFLPPPNAAQCSIYPPPVTLPPHYISAQTLMDSLGEISYMMDADFQGRPTSWNKKNPDKPTHQGQMNG